MPVLYGRAVGTRADLCRDEPCRWFSASDLANDLGLEHLGKLTVILRRTT